MNRNLSLLAHILRYLGACYSPLLQMGLLGYLRWLLHGTLLPKVLLHRQATTPG